MTSQSQVLPFTGSRRLAQKTVSTKDRINLAKLQKMDFAALNRLYTQLAPPDTLDVLNGEHRGKLLAIAGIHRTPLGHLIDLFGKTPLFPWTGTTFSARSLIKGSGINRINLSITRQEWFAFRTSFKSSLVDSRPCIHLSYALRENPLIMRGLVNEVRQVEPGLYLGPTFLPLGKRRLKLLYFAIEQ